jgi:hypothetical protein
VCSRYIDPISVTIRILCDCAQGYFGTKSCEPLNQLIELPFTISQLGGYLPLTIPDDGVDLEIAPVPFPTGGAMNEQRQYCALEAKLQFEMAHSTGNKSGSLSFLLCGYYSAFKTLGQAASSDYSERNLKSMVPLPAKEITILASLYGPLLLDDAFSFEVGGESC